MRAVVGMRPVAATLKAVGLRECETCRSWHWDTKAARDFHLARCSGVRVHANGGST